MFARLPSWLEYFRKNSMRTPRVPWREQEALADHERRRISSSIATFQLGENSEGRQLLKRAQQMGSSVNRSELAAITQLFIKEEQKHAQLLARFMATHNIALKKNRLD